MPSSEVAYMNRKQREAADLTRTCLYGLAREYLLSAMIKSTLAAERKGLAQLFSLLYFVQGKRRFPRKDELYDFLSKVIDRNLSLSEMAAEYSLDLDSDPIVDDPETYFLETLETLEAFRRFQEGWSHWIDGKN
jgi:hypothetical protein